ncbi:Lrp/AsnC family transcriptional regulator [Pseudoruegeria sp. SHC-113]|uniref:Lrp/AsnC family transcriptional regulator n=1 Tax=Pseudoruegeria sp. SHC-113 TaxID=2855439 RepID=UPI0021BBADF5|nr:Lrp/AsnC family transcriptional regulator [Pseudoruegeria sp. SHC-113]MCT8160731.1 Lrp/AsnC family transcriptional regulator [Pseudoruegeria sp. SHC-113]
MAQKTDSLQKRSGPMREVDAVDRRILGELARDASQSFAQLGEAVGLSAPAVHERVKRLKAQGVIKGTVAQLDGARLGKPLLAFVHVTTKGWGKTRALMALADLPEVEEIHSATGDTCLIMKVRVASSLALEGLLSRIYDLPEVRGTQTYVALSTHLERSPQAEVTVALEAMETLR